MKNSKIGWTHHSFNPWWGCARVSPGCEHCYAEEFSNRLGKRLWGSAAPRQMASEKMWGDPVRWNAAAERAGERQRVFCASMGDVFELRWDLEDAQERLFKTIEATPWLDWLLLTKRPENIREVMRVAACKQLPGNVWLGVTVENQAMAEKRIPLLLDIPVPSGVHFLSVEPMLGRMDLRHDVWYQFSQFWGENMKRRWLIVGGESGRDGVRREMDLLGAETLVRAARGEGHAVYVKQDSGRVPGRQGRIPCWMWNLKQFPVPVPMGHQETEGARV